MGSHSNNNHLDKSIAAYTDWKRVQAGEAVHDANALEQQILLSISVEQEELRTLQRQDEEIQSNSQRLVGVDTSAALAFANQLDVDRVVLQVEIKDLTFRLQEFQDYLKKNF